MRFEVTREGMLQEDNIHCVEADRVAAQAKKDLSQQTATLTQDKDDSDSFVDCKEDNDELQTNECILNNNTDQINTAHVHVPYVMNFVAHTSKWLTHVYMHV